MEESAWPDHTNDSEGRGSVWNWWLWQPQPGVLAGGLFRYVEIKQSLSLIREWVKSDQCKAPLQWANSPIDSHLRHGEILGGSWPIKWSLWARLHTETELKCESHSSMCYWHAARGTCGMWNTRTCFSSMLWGMFLYTVAWCFFKYLLYLAQQTTQRLLPVATGECLGWCCSHTLHMTEVSLLDPAKAVDCCAIVSNELQAEFIYEYVEGAKVVARRRVGCVTIHVDVHVAPGSNTNFI